MYFYEELLEGWAWMSCLLLQNGLYMNFPLSFGEWVLFAKRTRTELCLEKAVTINMETFGSESLGFFCGCLLFSVLQKIPPCLPIPSLDPSLGYISLITSTSIEKCFEKWTRRQEWQAKLNLQDWQGATMALMTSALEGSSSSLII